MRSRKKKLRVPIKVLGRLEKGGVYVLKLTNWCGVEVLGDILDGWMKVIEDRKLDLTILVLTPDLELLDARKLKKYQGGPPTEGAGPSTADVEMVVNVDGEVVPKGSDKDDRWGPYGTETVKEGYR